MKETPKAQQAFVDYVALGPSRSLEELVRRYQTGAKSVPTRRLNTLKTWSSSFFWQRRIAEAASLASERMLVEASEIDAETFLRTSIIIAEIAKAAGDGTIELSVSDLVKLRESVRKPQAKTTATVDVNHSGTIKHTRHDMSAFTDEEIDALAEIATRKRLA